MTEINVFLKNYNPEREMLVVIVVVLIKLPVGAHSLGQKTCASNMILTDFSQWIFVGLLQSESLERDRITSVLLSVSFFRKHFFTTNLSTTN